MTRSNVRGVALWILLAGTPAFAACNMLTGADDVRYSDDDDGGTGGTTASNTSSGNGAAGATTSGQGGATNGPGATNGTTTSGNGGSGGNPPNCDYPTGPYGVAQGNVVPPTITWQGYAPGAASPSTIRMEDLFDCDGSRGIDAIIIDTSQYG